MTTSAALFLCCVSLAATPAEYILETAPSKRIEGVINYRIEAPRLKATRWVVVAASAPALPCQKEVATRLEPAGVAVAELSPQKRGILRAQLRDPEDPHSIDIRVHYQATLLSRRLVAMDSTEPSANVPDLSAQDRLATLASTRMYDFEGERFVAWRKQHDLHRGADETDVELARRVFLTIKRGFRYIVVPSDGRSASTVCKSRKSDCGGLSVLFVAAMRSNGVPARALVGRWAQSAKPGQKIGGVPNVKQHVKAEFFAARVGWVPVDLSSAILLDRVKDGLRFFGNDPGDFLVMHVDPELVVDSVHFGRKKQPWMQGPLYWAVGTGTFAGHTIRETWDVRVTKPVAEKLGSRRD